MLSVNIVMCPMTFELKNGNYTMIMNDKIPEYEMEMTCNEGYIMRGVKRFTCKKGGLWDQTPSVTKCVGNNNYCCIAISKFLVIYVRNKLIICSFLIAEGCTCAKVKNGVATCHSASHYMLAYVKCNNGYTLNGKNPGYCLNGKYLYLPTCK